jgi:hypothetical protein
LLENKITENQWKIAETIYTPFQNGHFWPFLTMSCNFLKQFLSPLSLCNKLNSVHKGIQHRYVLMINVTIVILRTMWLSYFKWWTHNWKASYRLLTIYNRYKLYYTFNGQSGMFFFQLFNWFQLFLSENSFQKVAGHGQKRSKMTILKGGVDGFSYIYSSMKYNKL